MAVEATILVTLAVTGTVTAAAAALVAMLVTLAVAAAVAIAGGTLDLLDLAGEERIDERVAVAGAAGVDGDARLVESVDGSAVDSSADIDSITASLPTTSSSSFIFQPPGAA